MARGASPQRPVGGGGGIQALRQARARLTLAAASAAAYAAVVAYAAAHTREAAGLVVAIGCLGGAVLLAVLWRGDDELLIWALAPAGIAYAVALAIGGHDVDAGAPLVGAGLLLCGELAAWSLDARWRVRGLHARRRGGAVAALAVAGVLAGGVVVAFAAAPAGGGLAWTALGAAGAVGAIGAAVAVAKRSD
ncbi:MAG TPA: hypothetical protein VFJ77_01540 [Gaiellaceae bacterium]|nr:hypothetical protein [Gaiellaceae bacterium]